ncbi:MAG: DsbA family oxidoreductase, partial [Geminicoccaceae bacterium]
MSVPNARQNDASAAPERDGLRVDIISDVVCPWCLIGFRRLERAAAQVDGLNELSLRWHAFELNPMMPPEGQNLREHVAEKYGASLAQSDRARERITRLGADLGVVFNYPDDKRMVNTRQAHELLAWAAVSGRQTQLKLALFDAYFTADRDVSDTEVLLDVATEVGLPRAEATQVLEDGRFVAAVRAEEARWPQLGIQGVPTFIVGGRYLVSGAQEEAVFIEVFERT